MGRSSADCKPKRRWFIGKSWKERASGFDLGCLLQAAGLTLFFAWFFYRSPFGLPAAMPLGALHYRNALEEKRDKARRRLRLRFQDMLLSVETNMRAGYSVENAFREAYRELSARYGARDFFCERLFSICQGLEHNLALEQLLLRFGEESDVEEIREFGEVFTAAKRSGGRMSEILVSSARLIGQTIDTEEEIQVLLSAKRMEGRIMQFVPFVLALYMQSASPDFFNPLYHNLPGVAVMTVMALLYGAANALSRKILAIHV